MDMMCKPCPAWCWQFGQYILALCEQYYTQSWLIHLSYLSPLLYHCRSSMSSATRLCWSSWTLLSCTLTSNRYKLYPQTEQVIVFIPLRIIWTIYNFIWNLVIDFFVALHICANQRANILMYSTVTYVFCNTLFAWVMYSTHDLDEASLERQFFN